MSEPARPTPRYVDLRFPDGSHTGVRVDWARGIIEVQKRGVKYYFDVADMSKIVVEQPEQTCYNFDR